MDSSNFFQSLGTYFSDSGNAYFALYALATGLLTQLCKKLFVDKIKVDVFNKFDLASVFPYIFGVGFACIDVFWVNGVRAFNVQVIMRLLVTTVSVGAMSSVGFRFVSSLSGQSLSKLLKDDAFKLLYDQLLYFGNVRQQLQDKSLTFGEFLALVKQIADRANAICASDDSEADKRSQIAALLSDVVDDDDLDLCVNAVYTAMTRSTAGK